MKRTTSKWLLILITLSVTTSLFTLFPVGAEDSVKKDNHNRLVEMKRVKIMGKSEGYIRASGMGFRVKANTVIIDQMGVKISLVDLPVPCKAEIYYRPIKTAHPKARKIIVTEIFPESSVKWSESE